jgi:hypothetical protein
LEVVPLKANRARRIAGQPIYLGERRPAWSICRDEVADALELVAAGDGGRSFPVEEVYATMTATGTSWPRATVAKTMPRMTRPARRPPFVRLERAAVNRYRVGEPVFAAGSAHPWQ